MEKKQLISELYDLRTALLLLSLEFDAIKKKERFELSWNDKHKDKNVWSITDGDLTTYYMWVCPLTTHFVPNSRIEWDVWENIITMFDLNRDNVTWRNMRWYYPNYIMLFDWTFADGFVNGNRICRKFYKKGSLFKKWAIDPEYFYKHGTHDGDPTEPFERCVRIFRCFNINVLQTEYEICQDALNNKRSALLKLYPKKVIEGIVIPEIKEQIDRQKKAIEKYKNLMLDRYGISVPRDNEIKHKDELLLKEMTSALKVLENKYSFISYRDWENIDGIIYFLETGRADTIKESLNLLDLRKYKDEIVGAIDSITRTMIQGIQAIRQDLNVYFNTLFDQLDCLNENLVGISYDIANNTAAINRSSEEIAHSINQIRDRMQ